MVSTKLIFLTWLFPCLCLSQVNNYATGSGQTQASISTAREDAFSVFNNPSTISAEESFLGLAARQYFLEEINEVSLAGSHHLGFGSIGFGLNYFGDELYSESMASIGVNRQLSPSVSLGASLVGVSYTAPFVDNQLGLFPQLGVRAIVNEEFSLASTMRNPFSQELNPPFDLQNQSWFSIGGLYEPNDRFNTSIQADILETDGFSAGIGGSYQVYKQFSVSFGGRVNPDIISAGVSILLNGFQTTIGSQHQSLLGFSPSFQAQKSF